MRNVLRNILAFMIAFTLLAGVLPQGGIMVFAQTAELAIPNYRNLSMTPGRNETEMRFTWHSTSVAGSVQFRVAGAQAWTTVNSTSRAFHAEYSGNYRVHQPVISGLLPNTTYEYRITWSGGQSEIKTFRTGGGGNFSFIAVADSQLGGSTADRTGWADTLSVAATAFPCALFVMSMGDQIGSSPNWDVDAAQTRFNHLFAPPEFSRLPFAAIPGNHDGVARNSAGYRMVNPELWHFHYNTPVTAPNVRGFTIPGRPYNPATQFDWYFRSGNVLFIMLAIYDSNTHGGAGTAARAEITGGRRTWIRNTINANQDADWRVAVFHMPPYSANRPVTETSKERVRENWIPIIEEFEFDIAFSGHDHIYSRSHHMQGRSGADNRGPGTPRLNQTWASVADNAVVDPIGITYIAFGSPSGHGLREPAFMPRPYIARYHQAGLREFSVVNVTPHTFSVATYMINSTGIDGNSITMTDIYTIVRSNRPGGTYIPAFCQVPRPVLPVVCYYCAELNCICPPAIFNMRRDPNWANILSATSHPITRGTNVSAANALRVDSPRELRFTGRTGTSQGLRIRAGALLDALSHHESLLQIEYSGRLNMAGSSQIRLEVGAPWVEGENVFTQAAAAYGGGFAFSQTATLTREQLQRAVGVGAGDITLGAYPSGAQLTITGVRITEILPVSGAFYCMQFDPDWDGILGHFGHPVMRGTGNPGVSAAIDGPPRELNFSGRTGTSQGLRIRAGALLDALSDSGNLMQIEYFGRLSVAGYSQIRLEVGTPWVNGENIWTEAAYGGAFEFSQTVALTQAQLQRAVGVGMGDITLGASPGGAVLTITGVRITEIAPPAFDCATCEDSGDCCAVCNPCVCPDCEHCGDSGDCCDFCNPCNCPDCEHCEDSGECCDFCNPCDCPDCEHCGDSGECCDYCNPCDCPDCTHCGDSGECCDFCNPCDCPNCVHCGDSGDCCDYCNPCNCPDCIHCGDSGDCCDYCNPCDCPDCEHCGDSGDCCEFCNPCVCPDCEHCGDSGDCCDYCNPCDCPDCEHCGDSGDCCDYCNPCDCPDCEHCGDSGDCCDYCNPCVCPDCIYCGDSGDCCEFCNPCDCPDCIHCGDSGDCCDFCNPCYCPDCEHCEDSGDCCDFCNPCDCPDCEHCGDSGDCCDFCNPCDCPDCEHCGDSGECCDFCNPCGCPDCVHCGDSGDCCDYCNPCDCPDCTHCGDSGECCDYCNPCDCPDCEHCGDSGDCCDYCNPCYCPDCEHCGDSGYCCDYCNPCTCPADSHIITFNPNGGTFVSTSSAAIIVANGDNSGLLPRAIPSIFSRTGYRFTGWFENPLDDSTRWHDYNAISGNITLYARWTRAPYNFHVGDSNGDGRTTSADATAIARYLAGQREICPLSADLNGDGIVTLEDLILLARWIVGHNIGHLIAQ